jgi:hypothetical protein
MRCSSFPIATTVINYPVTETIICYLHATAKFPRRLKVSGTRFPIARRAARTKGAKHASILSGVEDCGKRKMTAKVTCSFHERYYPQGVCQACLRPRCYCFQMISESSTLIPRKSCGSFAVNSFLSYKTGSSNGIIR